MVNNKEDAEKELKNRLEKNTDCNILDVSISSNPIYTVTVEGTEVPKTIFDICESYLGYKSVEVEKVRFTDEYDEAMQSIFYI